MTQKVFQRPKDDPGTERFMEYFYKHCADVLFNPVLDLPDFKSITGEPCVRFHTDIATDSLSRTTPDFDT